MQGELRAWLKREPHPARVRAIINGDERVVRINASRSRWRDAEQALEGCTRAEALNDDGETLRTWDQGEELHVRKLEAASNSQIVELARLLNEAADNSVQRHSDAYRLAYEQQAQLVRILSERLAAFERVWHKMFIEQAEKLPDGDPNLPLVAAVLGQLGPGLLEHLAAQKNGAKQ